VQTTVETAWSERERRKTIKKTRTIVVLNTCVQTKEKKTPNCNWLKVSLDRHPFYRVQCDHGVGSGFERANRGVECPWRAVSWELAQGSKRRPHLWRLKTSLERLAIHHSWPPPFYLVQSIALVDTSQGNRPPWFFPLRPTEKENIVHWDWLGEWNEEWDSSKMSKTQSQRLSYDHVHNSQSLYFLHTWRDEQARRKWSASEKWREKQRKRKAINGTNQRLV
jgi:hypothetical protein